MNQKSPSPSLTNNDLGLLTSVNKLAGEMQNLSDADLDQRWAWGPHAEGVRFALLGTYQELRELAVRLAEERRLSRPVTTAQHALAQYHAAKISPPSGVMVFQPCNWPAISGMKQSFVGL